MGHIQKCDIVVIEMQLDKNPMCLRLEQHIISWLTFNFMTFKEIVIFGAYNKTRVLGCPKKITSKKTNKLINTTKSFYKRWSCDVANHILRLRKDMETFNIIFNLNKKKQDDLSDVIVQLQAFKVKRFIDRLER